ncbi:MAG: hypothetical protein ACREYC_25675, partial [Gammaproteobacteria bacterium]
EISVSEVWGCELHNYRPLHELDRALLAEAAAITGGLVFNSRCVISAFLLASAGPSMSRQVFHP